MTSLAPVPSSAAPAACTSLESLTNLPAEHLLAGQQRVLEMVAAGRPLAETLTAIAEFSEEAIPSMMASVLIFDPESQSLRKGGYGRSLSPKFQEAIDGMKPGPDVGSCGAAAYRSERVTSRDVRVDPRWTPFVDFAAMHGIISAWSTPLKNAKGELLGVFGMYYGDTREPSKQDLRLVDHFVHLAAIAVDRWRQDAERERRATQDVLTGLGNRLLLQEVAARMAADPAYTDVTCALVMLDCDHFKLHNDLLGQRKADQLLQQVALRIRGQLGQVPLLARFDGDQFVAILPERNGAAQRRVEDLLVSLRTPLLLGDSPVTVTLSAGVVEWQPRSMPLDDTLMQAIEAAEVAKRLGRDRVVVFGDSERARITGNRIVTRVLRDALDEDRVEPFLQPIIRLADGRPSGFEVLARLRGGDAAGISPSVFVPIAEESDLIVKLGDSVLRFAFRTLAEQAEAFRGLTLSVNLSVRQLVREGLADRAAVMAREHGVAPERVVLEVTESQWLDVDSPARANLLALKEAGFRLAVDDFGTRYASLSLLQAVPFDHVKIDRSLTQQLALSPRGRALCEAGVAMARACQIPVTAEGVETADQAEALRAMGYDLGQGYLWSRPMPVGRVLAWLSRHPAA
ncbi:MAG: EAL domain-containing protein [Planctomycetes bacterium]|nr:EAL domain-containing protein [Planctomycetota bacterium]